MTKKQHSRNRTFSRGIALSGLLVFALLVSGCWAKKPKVYRVGILCGLEYFAAVTDGFKTEMEELGYVEGENVVYDVQSTDFDIPTYQSMAQQFVDDEVDLIFAYPMEAAIEVKAITEGTDIPMVFAYTVTEGSGIVESVRAPGGNITGVRFPAPDLALKRLEIMRELMPQATRMLVPYQRGYPTVQPQLEAISPAAEAAGITLIEVPADNAAELEAVLQAHFQADGVGADVIMLLAEPLVVAPEAFAVVGKFSYEHNVPIGGTIVVTDDYETVFGVNVEEVAAGKLAASQADKIFKGTQAGTIPVVSPENYIVINYRLAQELGIAVPESLLGQANEVIR